MNDFMRWLYAHYIKPHIELIPKDSGDRLHFSLMENDTTSGAREDIAAALRFYACHGFLLGLRTGVGLSSALPQQDR